MEHSLEDLSVAKLEELAAHLSKLQDTPAGSLSSTPSTSGDTAKKVSGFVADGSYLAARHRTPSKYGELDDSVAFSSYRPNKLSPVSSTDFLNMPNFSHKPQAYSSRFRQRDECNNASGNSFDREPDHSPNYRPGSPPFYADGDEHSYERSVSSGRRQRKSFQTSYKSRSRSPRFSKDHRRRRSSSNSNSDSSTKTVETSAFRYRSRSPRIFKNQRRRRSSESSSGSSTKLSPSRITASKAPQIDDDMASLLKRVDEVRKRSKILQAQAAKNTSVMPHIFPGFQGQNSRGLLAVGPETRPPNFISSVPPPLLSHASAEIGSPLSCSSNYPMMPAITLSSKPVPIASSVAQKTNSKALNERFDCTTVGEAVSSGSVVEQTIFGPSSFSLNSAFHQTHTTSHAVIPKLVQGKTYLSKSAIPRVYSSFQKQNPAIVPAACCSIIPTKCILPVAPPALSELGHAYAGFGNPSPSSSTIPLMASTASSECVPMTSSAAVGSEYATLGESNEARFDYVGFFVECFHRMPDEHRTDLENVVMLLHRVLTTKSVQNGPFFDFKPVCLLVSKIWRSSISVNGSCFDGYGLFANSAILNALGFAFPDKIADLQDFARDQGFVGWKLARKQYCSVYCDKKYDAVRAKLWTELNGVFFMKSSSSTYWRKDGGQVVYQKLREAVAQSFRDTDAMITAGSVCIGVRVSLRDTENEKVLTGTHFSMGSACLTLISSLFDVPVQIKFLDDLMLLLGQGDLKRNAYNKVAADFYFDLLLARVDFLAALCETYTNLDPAVKKLIGGSVDESAGVLEYLVADDHFYYNLLGWIFGKWLRTDSYEEKQFFKMWSVSRSRSSRGMNISKVLWHRAGLARLESDGLAFIDEILKSFTDPKIFISKVCQSNYACSMVEFFLSEQPFDEKLHQDLRYYASKVKDHIAVGPYTPLCAQALLRNDTRPLVYGKLESITGLVLVQVESEKRASSIRLMCRDRKDSELVKIIHECVLPSQFEVVLDVASRDILYVPAIMAFLYAPTVGCMSFASERSWWHVGFWRNLAQDAQNMPDLRCSPAAVKAGLSGIVAPGFNLPYMAASSVSSEGKPPRVAALSPEKCGRIGNITVPSLAKRSKQNDGSIEATTSVSTAGRHAPEDQLTDKEIVDVVVTNLVESVIENLSIDEVLKVLHFMEEQKKKGPAHRLIVSTPGWMKLLRLAVQDEQLCPTLKDAIACKNDASAIFTSFAKRWYRLRSLPKVCQN